MGVRNRSPYLARTILFTCILGASAEAQSTSNWIRVEPIPGGIQVPALGASYVTIQFVTGSVYQKSTWWTNAVERNRQAVLDVQVNAQVGGIQLKDTRMSDPVELRKKDAQVDFGYSGVLVDRMPTTYNTLRVSVQVSKTAADGADQLVKSVAELSKSNPALQISQSAIGIVSAAKEVADFLFNKQLIQKRMSSIVDFSPMGNLAPAGVYVALAGDGQNDYLAYLAPPPPGGAGLVWTGSQLTWNGQPLKKVSYFVVKVRYDDKVFSQPMNALGLNPVAKPWVGLYQIARREVPTITSAAEVGRVLGEIRSHLSDAQTLLEQDLDFTQAERDQIHEAIRSETEAKVNERIRALAALQPATPAATDGGTLPTTSGTASSVVTPVTATPQIQILLPDNTTDRAIARDIVAEQIKTKPAKADSTNTKPPPR